jgi:hypothetical protein
MNTILVDILLLTTTSLTNDFYSSLLVISNSKDERVITLVIATLVTSTRLVKIPTKLLIRIDT